MNGKKMAATSVAALFLLLAGFGIATAQNDTQAGQEGATDGEQAQTGGQEQQQVGDQQASGGEQAGDEQLNLGAGQDGGDLQGANMDMASICGFELGERNAGGASEGGAAEMVADTSADSTQARVQTRTAEIDREDVFNALAINANNGQEISFNELADVDAAETMTHTVVSTSGFDEEDVFSALALGINAEDDSQLHALACVSDKTETMSETRAVSQRVNLDRDDTLLAIALSNSAGGELDWRDIADITRTEAEDVSVDRDITVSEDDTFLALALGLGGRDGGNRGGSE